MTFRLHFVVPRGYEDSANPSGGNVYDRRIRDGLKVAGCRVDVHQVGGSWPAPDPDSARALRATLSSIPDGSAVLVDGLVGALAPDVVIPETMRLRLILLVHMPFGLADDQPWIREAEAATLRAASAVITPSAWTRELLLTAYQLAPERVHAAPPGVDRAPRTAVSPGGSRLLCVAAVTAVKGHDILIESLAELSGDDWRCTLVGPLDREPDFVTDLQARLLSSGMAERVTFAGPLAADELARAYASADVLLLPSRFEAFGIVILEALARGLPVIASRVGGVPEAMGCADEGRRPGILVPPESPVALRGAIHRWLSDAELRRVATADAGTRREQLTTWEATVAVVAMMVTSSR